VTADGRIPSFCIGVTASVTALFIESKAVIEVWHRWQQLAKLRRWAQRVRPVPEFLTSALMWQQMANSGQ